MDGYFPRPYIKYEYEYSNAMPYETIRNFEDYY